MRMVVLLVLVLVKAGMGRVKMMVNDYEGRVSSVSYTKTGTLFLIFISLTN